MWSLSSFKRSKKFLLFTWTPWDVTSGVVFSQISHLLFQNLNRQACAKIKLILEASSCQEGENSCSNLNGHVCFTTVTVWKHIIKSGCVRLKPINQMNFRFGILTSRSKGTETGTSQTVSQLECKPRLLQAENQRVGRGCGAAARLTQQCCTQFWQQQTLSRDRGWGATGSDVLQLRSTCLHQNYNFSGSWSHERVLPAVRKRPLITSFKVCVQSLSTNQVKLRAFYFPFLPLWGHKHTLPACRL